MRSLANSYCKELIGRLDLIPVYLPGTPISVGDIITFGSGIFDSNPIGSFRKIGSLESLEVEFETEIEPKEKADSYLYASKGAVSVAFNANANAGPLAKAELDISFKEEGATYFAALDCTLTSMKDIINLQKKLEKHKDIYNWEDYFIVTSVLIAGNALIMQSNSSASNLKISGDVKGLEPTSTIKQELDASASVGIESYSDSSLIVPWSENVEVAMGLAKFRRSFFGDWNLDIKTDTIPLSV